MFYYTLLLNVSLRFPSSYSAAFRSEYILNRSEKERSKSTQTWLVCILASWE